MMEEKEPKVLAENLFDFEKNQTLLRFMDSAVHAYSNARAATKKHATDWPLAGRKLPIGTLKEELQLVVFEESEFVYKVHSIA